MKMDFFFLVASEFYFRFHVCVCVCVCACAYVCVCICVWCVRVCVCVCVQVLDLMTLTVAYIAIALCVTRILSVNEVMAQWHEDPKVGQATLRCAFTCSFILLVFNTG